MAVPSFTGYGLLPAGVHECTFLEAERLLCLNDRRIAIWQGLMGFLEWAQQLPTPTAYLLDGSYVTDKPLPADVDVVVDITTCIDVDQSRWFEEFAQRHDFVKQRFQVDFYPFVIGFGSDFSAFFQYVKVDEALRRGVAPNVTKGLLRIEP